MGDTNFISTYFRGLDSGFMPYNLFGLEGPGEGTHCVPAYGGHWAREAGPGARSAPSPEFFPCSLPNKIFGLCAIQYLYQLIFEG